MAEAYAHMVNAPVHIVRLECGEYVRRASFVVGGSRPPLFLLTDSAEAHYDSIQVSGEGSAVWGAAYMARPASLVNQRYI